MDRRVKLSLVKESNALLKQLQTAGIKPKDRMAAVRARHAILVKLGAFGSAKEVKEPERVAGWADYFDIDDESKISKAQEDGAVIAYDTKTKTLTISHDGSDLNVSASVTDEEEREYLMEEVLSWIEEKETRLKQAHSDIIAKLSKGKRAPKGWNLERDLDVDKMDDYEEPQIVLESPIGVSELDGGNALADYKIVISDDGKTPVAKSYQGDVIGVPTADWSALIETIKTQYFEVEIIRDVMEHVGVKSLSEWREFVADEDNDVTDQVNKDVEKAYAMLGAKEAAAVPAVVDSLDWRDYFTSAQQAEINKAKNSGFDISVIDSGDVKKLVYTDIAYLRDDDFSNLMTPRLRYVDSGKLNTDDVHKAALQFNALVDSVSLDLVSRLLKNSVSKVGVNLDDQTVTIGDKTYPLADANDQLKKELNQYPSGLNKKPFRGRDGVQLRVKTGDIIGNTSGKAWGTRRNAIATAKKLGIEATTSVISAGGDRFYLQVVDDFPKGVAVDVVESYEYCKVMDADVPIHAMYISAVNKIESATTELMLQALLRYDPRAKLDNVVTSKAGAIRAQIYGIADFVADYNCVATSSTRWVNDCIADAKRDKERKEKPIAPEQGANTSPAQLNPDDYKTHTVDRLKTEMYRAANEFELNPISLVLAEWLDANPNETILAA